MPPNTSLSRANTIGPHLEDHGMLKKSTTTMEKTAIISELTTPQNSVASLMLTAMLQNYQNFLKKSKNYENNLESDAGIATFKINNDNE